MSRAERVEAEFVLTEAERAQLLRWSHGESARLAVRAKIVLACAEPGVVYERLAAALGVTTMTVGAWRKRFARARCDGLADFRRSGRPKAELVVTDAEREQLIRWSRRGKPRRRWRCGRRSCWPVRTGGRTPRWRPGCG